MIDFIFSLAGTAAPYLAFVLLVVFGGEAVCNSFAFLQALFSSGTIRKRRFILLWAVAAGVLFYLLTEVDPVGLIVSLVLSNHFYDAIRGVQAEDVFRFVERYVFPALPGVGRSHYPGTLDRVDPGAVGDHLAGSAS